MIAHRLRHIQRLLRRMRTRRPSRSPSRRRTAARNVAVLWLIAALGIGAGIALRLHAGDGGAFGHLAAGNWQALGRQWRAGLDKWSDAVPETAAKLTGQPSWETMVMDSALPKTSWNEEEASGGGATDAPWRRVMQLALAIILGYDVTDEEAVLTAAMPRNMDVPAAPFVEPMLGGTGETNRDDDRDVSLAQTPIIETAANIPASPPPSGGTRLEPPGPPTATPPTSRLNEVDDRDGVNDPEEARATIAGGRLQPEAAPPSAPDRVTGADRKRGAGMSATGACRVLVLHSHTSEMYRTDDFAPERPDEFHLWNTTESGIVQVGRALTRALHEKYGVPTCHLTTVHDWPSHVRAYIESRESVEAFLRRNPQVELVLDVHRDSPPDLVATVAGRSVARIAVVVGTHPTMHPGSATNVALARHIARIMDDKYPGVFRRVIERPDARFNQDLHPRMIILEVGSYDTHLDTALATVDLLADVLEETVHGIRTSALPGVGSPR